MSSDQAVEICKSAMLLALTLGGPVLLTAFAVSLVVNLLQSVTQMHDPSLGFIPKLIVMSLMILILLPWGLERMSEYAIELIRDIPSTTSGGG